ncbi:Protein N-acetyltransferase, RimJ/RimL family [Clostridium acidisoli DSM 12555]|uniref:Protein N-acetyltransferase, RimJ/RimL family n=1 Tax=Clostridium acidisoli DSM 12555 TaxID=1121291 RepID=A0A1W1XJ65_9CLOT|nr:GNAT family N-acetyltransferase [Clostridium acidisoli]SMC24005.1 Protein N-acetyltransferase, RimJ/RimL family [Clostridium acidisoli DSM 12555]
MIYFENEKIKIRSVIQEDIVYLFSWWIDKEVYRNDPKPMPCNSKEVLQECKSYCETFECEIVNNSRYEYFMIVNREDYPIGFVNFFDVNKEKGDGELGVIIGDKRYWNKGIASLAVSKVKKILFNRPEINRIHIETAEGNLAARKLFKKLGFNECSKYLDEGFKFIVMESRRL